MKKTDYFIKIMAIWVTLYELEGSRTGKYLIDSSGTKETNQLTCRQPFGINFRYKHQVDYQNNCRHAPIFLGRTWANKFWPDRNFPTGSSPRCPLQSHSLICIKNHLFIVGIGPILNKILGFIYWSDRSDRTYVYSLVS